MNFGHPHALHHPDWRARRRWAWIMFAAVFLFGCMLVSVPPLALIVWALGAVKLVRALRTSHQWRLLEQQRLVERRETWGY